MLAVRNSWRRKRGVGLIVMVGNVIAAAAALLMLMLMSALAIAHLMVLDCWVLDGNDVSSLYLEPSEFLEPRDLGRVVANSTGCYFGSDFGCKSVHRYMDYDAELYRPFVVLLLLEEDSTRRMCTDTEFD